MNVQEVTTTYNCLTPGCEREARSTRGVHAYCADCQEKRRSHAAPKPAVGYEATAKRLVACGRALDKARSEAERATADYRRLREQWARLVAEISGSQAG